MPKAVLTALVAALASAVACFGGASPAMASTGTVLFLNGTTGNLAGLLPAGTFGNDANFLSGAYPDHRFEVVDYPATAWPFTGPLDATFGESVAAGTRNLSEVAGRSTGELVIVGVSQGAVVVQHAAGYLNSNPTLPSETTFMMIANPNTGVFSGSYGRSVPILQYIPAPVSETRFNTVVVVNEYDLVADPIDRPWNLLAAANALMALVYVHPFVLFSDLSRVPPGNISVSTNSLGGTTTTYLVPTDELPLTMPLRQAGVPRELVDGVDAILRPLIDSAYERTAPGTSEQSWQRNRPHSRTQVTEPDRRISPARRPDAAATVSAPPRGSSSPRGATGTSARR